MALLSRFSHAHPNLYFSLFSGVDPSNAKSKELFDAASFGIYLTGGDPRNNRGWLDYYKDVNDHGAKPSEYIFSLTKENTILATSRTSEFVIQNLHIHSKNPKIFATTWPSEKLISQITKSGRGMAREFSFRAYWFLVQGFVARRTKRILGK
jgi:hypothetical protein